MGIVGAADIEADIGRAGDELGVRHHADGGGVEHHVVVAGAQLADGLVESRTGHQLGGVGRHDTAGQHVEVGMDTRGLDEREEVGVLWRGKVLRDAVLAVGDVEHLVEPGLADVQADDDHLLAQQGEADSEVGGQEGLALAAHGGGDEDDVLLRAVQQEEEVGAQVAEGLSHEAVLVLADGDGAGLLVAEGHIAQDGDGGEPLDIGTALDAEAEQLEDVDDGDGQADAGHEGEQVNHLGLGRDGGVAGHGFVDDLGLVGRGGQGDVVFLALLEEHEVEAGLNLLLALDAHVLALLLGGVADAAGVAAGLAVEVGLGDEQLLARALEAGRQALAQAGQLGVEATDDGVGLRRGAQEAVALDHALVVGADEGGDGLVGEADVDGQDVMDVLGARQVVQEVADEVELGAVGHHLLLVIGLLAEGHLGIAAEVRQAGAALELLELGFGGAQLGVDDGDALVDEAGGVAGHFVLVVVGVAVVVLDEPVEEVLTPTAVGVGEGDGDHGRGFAGGLHGEGAGIALGHGQGGADGDVDDGFALGQGDTGTRQEGEGTDGRGQHGREAVEAGGGYLDFIEGGHGLYGTIGLEGDIDAEGGGQAVGTAGGEVEAEGRTVVEVGARQAVLATVGDVEAEVGHNLVGQRLAAQDLDLVIDAAGGGEHAQVLEESQVAVDAAALLVVLDEDGGADVIDGRGEAQVNPRQGEADHYGGHDPGPADEVGEEEGAVVGLLFAFVEQVVVKFFFHFIILKILYN